MLRSIYAAASGMGTQLDNVNIYANNIANAATSGFKRSELVSRPFSDLVLQLAGNETGKMGLGVGSAFAKQDLRQGVLVPTSNPLDFAVQGGGFFEVQATEQDGTVRPLITRDGNFTLNSSRQLVNQQGHVLMSDSDSPITLTQTNPNAVHLRDDGTIFENNRAIGKIKLVKVVQPEPTGFDSTQPRLVANLQPTNEIDTASVVKQSYLESSNVEIIREMIGLISSSKAYDTSQRLISISDKTLDRSINEMGRMQ